MSTASKPAGCWITGGDANATQRSLAWLADNGYLADVAERWVPRIERRPDTYAQTLAEQLDRIANEFGGGRPWGEAIEAGAAKLRAMAEGPFYLPGGHRKDLFGFIDILAISDKTTVAVQATSRAKTTEHIRKYRRDDKVRAAILKWISKPSRAFVIFGWARKEIPNAKGSGTHRRWFVEERWVTTADLEEKPF